MTLLVQENSPERVMAYKTATTKNLNDLNGASLPILGVAGKALSVFEKDLIGAEFGIAYGGSVKTIGQIWKDKGIIYGFDTFDGHPKEVALKDPCCNFSKDSQQAACMDFWYDRFDNRELTIEYQQNELNKERLSNVRLVKGLIDEKSNIDYIPYLNYALLDLDIPLSMKNVFNLIEPKLVKGAFLCLHDVLPKGHLAGLSEWYETILASQKFDIVWEYPNSHLAVLQKL